MSAPSAIRQKMSCHRAAQTVLPNPHSANLSLPRRDLLLLQLLGALDVLELLFHAASFRFQMGRAVLDPESGIQQRVG